MNRCVFFMAAVFFCNTATASDRYIGTVSPDAHAVIHAGSPAVSGETGPALEGPRWVLSQYLDESGALQPVIPGTVIDAQFTAGKLSGSAGCNNYSASYEIGDSHVTIGPAVTTRRQCAGPEGIMAQEQQFLQALAEVRQYKLTADRLELRDSNNSLQVAFAVTVMPEQLRDPGSRLLDNR